MNNQFLTELNSIIKTDQKLQSSLEKISLLISQNKYMEAFFECYETERISEKLTNQTRLLPIASGQIGALAKIENIILEENNVIIQYTPEGWLHIKIPSLLPKKEKGNASYIRATVNSAMKKFFEINSKKVFESKSVIIFQHIYDQKRPEREYRDHDNIEINVIVDLIALYYLIDDSPMLCKHYYTSAVGDTDLTNIFIVPFNEFPEWLKNQEKDKRM